MPHRCGIISLRYRNVCRALVTGSGAGQGLMSSIECPPAMTGYDIGATSRLRTRGSIRLRDDVPAKTDTHDCCPIREHRSIKQITAMTDE